MAYKTKIISLLDDEESLPWLSAVEPQFLKYIDEAKSSTELKELDKVTAYWIALAIFKFLACWDVEFQYKYFVNASGERQFIPQPLFSYFLPKINQKYENNPCENFPSRGLFRLPMRHLLVFIYSLGNFYREKKWPLKGKITDDAIATFFEIYPEKDTLQSVKKINRGTKGIKAKEFEDIWESMVKTNDTEVVPEPPWPLYIAAQIWTLLFAKFREVNGSKSVSTLILINPCAYQYWWNIYFDKSTNKDAPRKNQPWPEYLKIKEEEILEWEQYFSK